LFVTLAILAFTGAVAEAAEGVTAALAPTKSAYYPGEPIELQLTVTNNWSHEISFAARYPTFRFNSHAGIRLSLGPAADRAGQTVQIGDQLTWNPNGRTPILPIAVGESWSVRVYLVRFPSDFAPGTYDVSYTLDLDVGESATRLDSGAMGSGKFQIVVLFPSEEQLAGVLADYAKRLDSLDYWWQRAALEALSVARSPLVIPYLAKVIYQGYTVGNMHALAKFRGNAEAESAVLVAIRAGSLSALAVADEWGYVLNSADFESLVGHPEDDNVRLTALRYAAKVANKAYLPTVTKLTGDSNAAVADRARQVEKLLSGLR
jgi:hypothetical protein